LDKPITYIGLDVHKDTIAVALAEAGGGKDAQDRKLDEIRPRAASARRSLFDGLAVQ
jgi:hypothetical protein